MALMYTQPKGGSVFNMEGAGSDGSATRKYAAYGFSKAGVSACALTGLEFSSPICGRAHV